MTRLLRMVVVVFGFVSVPASAYELATHAQMTDAAFLKSILWTDPSLIGRLGLLDAPERMGSKYFDMTSAGVFTRSSNKYERGSMPAQALALLYDNRIRGWLMRGAIREDDGQGLAAFKAGEPYILDPDPAGNINRFCNHFFDPIYVRGLTTSDAPTLVVCDLGNRRKSVDWATGAVDPFAQQTAAAPNFRNHFTIYAAREAMWRALTLRTKEWTPVPDAAGATTRRAYWATVFRALGNVVHHVQDMAQPQHTRNEPHGVGDAARYERHLDERASQKRVYDVDEETLEISEFVKSPLNLDLSDYPIPSFLSYAKYWTDTTSGRGLADYSNRGFLTPGKWFNDPKNDFALPSKNPADYAPVTKTPQNDICAERVQAKIRYLEGGVVDTFVGGAAEPTLMASAGNGPGGLSANDCVLDSRAALLLPRAVAYSAGVINHFFRGKLTVKLPPDGVYAIVDHSTQKVAATDGFRKVTINLVNDSPSLGGATQSMTGVLAAVVKYRRNTCYMEDLSGEWGKLSAAGVDVFKFTSEAGCRSDAEDIVVSNLIENVAMSVGVEKTYVFTFNDPIPINATDVYLQVVFRGALGNEDDAVVVETRDIGEPAFTSYQNTTDYVVCHNGNLIRRVATAEVPQSVIDQYPLVTFDNFTVKYGANALVKVTPLSPNPGALAPGQLIRFATLGELTRGWSHSGEINGEPFTVNHESVSDGRVRANQVYESYDEIALQITKDQHSKEIFKVPFGYAAFGRTYYVGNSSCAEQFPTDEGPPPMLRGIAIEYAPVNP